MNEKNHHTKSGKPATSQDPLWRGKLDPKKECLQCGAPLVAHYVAGGLVMKCGLRCRVRREGARR